MNESFSPCQKSALADLESKSNLFVTGRAGTGKSYLIQKYLRGKDSKKSPVIASTGAAAMLIGGRTFHSFFGLGIMEGGLTETVKRAAAQKYLTKRLRKVDQVVIDEISMIPGVALQAAEWIARKARDNSSPWGGIRVIAVGDFFQLPPVVRGDGPKDWSFSSQAWGQSQLRGVQLETMMRTKDLQFLRVLNEVREGNLNAEVRTYLNDKVKSYRNQPFDGTRLFPRRARVEEYNLEMLNQLPGSVTVYDTTYKAEESRFEDDIRKNAPVPEKLVLKEGALVMIRKNDPELRYANGSLGRVTELKKAEITIELLDGEEEVSLDVVEFTLLDSEGNPRASAKNFPVNLAYATTIHKAQGMTLDRATMDLRGAWEHGQAYVALSRVKTGAGLFLEGWDPRAFTVDRDVVDFYRESFEVSQNFGIEADGGVQELLL